MSTNFYQHLLSVVESGLDELNASIASGKTSATPVSETYFLSNWVTKSIKQQRFDHSAKTVLLSWQQQSRSMGKNAGLKQQFESIKQAYRAMLSGKSEFDTVTASQLIGFFDALEELEWEVTLDYPVLRKVSHFTDGHDSLVVCIEQQKAGIQDDKLVKPLSFFVRGDKSLFINLAAKHGLLLHKVTDYKSKVKYHGEYLVYPSNSGPIIAEIPTEI